MQDTKASFVFIRLHLYPSVAHFFCSSRFHVHSLLRHPRQLSGEQAGRYRDVQGDGRAESEARSGGLYRRHRRLRHRCRIRRLQRNREKSGRHPALSAPGNHDVRWNPLGKEGFLLGTNGKLYQSWDYQNIHFVLLDSTVLLEHWGHISQEQLDWLSDDLKKVEPDKPVIIGFHHPIGGVLYDGG